MKYILISTLSVLIFIASANLWILGYNTEIFHTEGLVPKREYVVVFGAGVKENGEPSQLLKDRLLLAVRLIEMKRVEKVLISGKAKEGERSETKAMYDFLKKEAVPSELIQVDKGGYKTLITIENAKQIFSIDNAIFVTTDFHMPRALFLAALNNVRAIGLTTDSSHYKKRWIYWIREYFSRPLAFVEGYTRFRMPRFILDYIPSI